MPPDRAQNKASQSKKPKQIYLMSESKATTKSKGSKRPPTAKTLFLKNLGPEEREQFTVKQPYALFYRDEFQKLKDMTEGDVPDLPGENDSKNKKAKLIGIKSRTIAAKWKKLRDANSPIIQEYNDARDAMRDRVIKLVEAKIASGHPEYEILKPAMKKKKKPGPDRAHTPWIHFCSAMRKQEPGIKLKVISERWKVLSDDEKAIYQEMFEKQKAVYDRKKAELAQSAKEEAEMAVSAGNN